MNDILRRIERKKGYFLSLTNTLAGRLLIGKKELADLEDEALARGIPRLRGLSGVSRAEIVGLKLYEMDDESYLEVAR